MGKPSAPTPPNPITTAAAQTGSNVSTGVANAFLNNVNQNTPQGSLTYDVTGNYDWTDPVTNQTYKIPRFTATQTLPSYATDVGWTGFSTDSANKATQYNQANIGTQMSWDLLNRARAGQLNTDPNADPYAAGDPNAINPGNALTTFGDAGQQQGSLGNTGQQITGFDQTGMPIYGTLADTGSQQMGFGGTQQGPQYGFDQAGNITRSYGPGDFSADRNEVENALMSRLQPSLDQQRSRLEQQLADQGINYGSEAYNNAMQTLNQQQTDARFAAIGQAGQEQQRMMEMAAQRAGFENAAQMQAYTQAQGRGTFANAAQKQEFEQQQARGQFVNQAQQTAYQQALQSGQFANAAEAQAFAEAKARGDFANAAQAEQYKQTLQSGQFANAAQQNTFQQQALRGQFANAGLAQQLQGNQAQYNARNTSRAQWLSEQYDKANQGINQITSLMSGSQVSKPSFVTPSNNQIANTDVAGIINNNFSQSLAAYNANNSQYQQLFGGLLGGLAGVLSDEREKNVGDKIGTVFAAGPDGEKPLPIYEFDYKRDPTGTRHIGPMAQDVEKIDRRAVQTVGGRKYIDATRMGSILRPHVLKKAA